MSQHKDPEHIISALMYLFSRQALHPETPLAPAIQEHLAMLSAHPHLTYTPLLKKTCERLLLHWSSQENNVQRKKYNHSDIDKSRFH